MRSHAKLGVGVIGMGFMGQTHLRAYQAAVADGFACELVAVCDANVAKATDRSTSAGNLAVDRSGAPLFDPAAVRTYPKADDLLNDERVRIVSICTYTETHVDLAIRALAAGKHVLVEKPVAITSKEVRRLADAAARSDTLCMPAMCMRFWPAWSWLYDRIRDQTFGSVRSAVFQRLGSRPTWTDFYADTSRCGGALFDLHIHDVDFIYWCFGRPESLNTNGWADHFTTQYRFASGPPHVTAEAAWDLQPSAGFRMNFIVTFEQATADFAITRTPQLLLHQRDRSEVIDVGPLTGYDLEIREFIKAVHEGGELRATLADAVAVTELLEAECRALTAS